LTLWQTAISPGFGLRFFSEYHSAAYFASSLQCFSFLSQILSPEEVSHYKNEIDSYYNRMLISSIPGNLPPLCDLFKMHKVQSVLSTLIDQWKRDSFMKSDKVSLRDNARLSGCSTQYAAAWMTCAPKKKKGIFFR
jgi:hypothetical protein